MHTLGVEVQPDTGVVVVWGFCPLTECERLDGTDCSVRVRVVLPPEPSPRPYRFEGGWRVPCSTCSGVGLSVTTTGYKRRVKCVSCAGSGHGQQVTSTLPWFRWNDLPRWQTTAACRVEAEPKRFTAVEAELPIVKRYESGKVVVMTDFLYVPEDPDEVERVFDVPVEREVPNVDPGPLSDDEWSSLRP